MLMMPQIAEEVSVFCDILRESSKSGAIFPLQEATTYLTIDTIGRVYCESSAQPLFAISKGSETPNSTHKGRQDFVSALRVHIPSNMYGTEMNPFNLWNPFRPLFQWYYT